MAQYFWNDKLFAEQLMEYYKKDFVKDICKQTTPLTINEQVKYFKKGENLRKRKLLYKSYLKLKEK